MSRELGSLSHRLHSKIKRGPQVDQERTLNVKINPIFIRSAAMVAILAICIYVIDLQDLHFPSYLANQDVIDPKDLAQRNVNRKSISQVAQNKTSLIAGSFPKEISQIDDTSEDLIAVAGDQKIPLCCEPDQINSYPFPKRVTLSHVEGWGDGIGFGTDYSTLALLFAPEYRDGHFLPMLDLRGHRFDNNSYAANVGIAARYIPRSYTCCEPNPCCEPTSCCEPKRFCEMLGVNLFYDYRGGLQGSFNQVGAGVEILGRRWDFRANGYVPFGRTSIKRTCVFDDYDHGDDESFSITHRKCEFTSYGYNAEVGYLLVNSCAFSLYVAGGPYYLARKCFQKTTGVLGRVRAQYKDYLSLEGSVSHDPVFETVWQAKISINIPFYQISSNACKKPPCRLRDRQIYQPIERFEVMPLGRRDCWETDFRQGSDDSDSDSDDRSDDDDN